MKDPPLLLSQRKMRKITQMIGRERVSWYLQTNSDRNSELCLEIRGQQVVVTTTISFFNSYSIKEYGTDKGHEEKYFRYEKRASNNKEQIRATIETWSFNLYFDSGIDDKGSWLQVLKDHKLVKVGRTVHHSI